MMAPAGCFCSIMSEPSGCLTCTCPDCGAVGRFGAPITHVGVCLEDFCVHGSYICSVPDCGDDVAWDRAETDPCERGTSGCSVLHGSSDTDCLSW